MLSQNLVSLEAPYYLFWLLEVSHDSIYWPKTDFLFLVTATSTLIVVTQYGIPNLVLTQANYIPIFIETGQF